MHGRHETLPVCRVQRGKQNQHFVGVRKIFLGHVSLSLLNMRASIEERRGYEIGTSLEIGRTCPNSQIAGSHLNAGSSWSWELTRWRRTFQAENGGAIVPVSKICIGNGCLTCQHSSRLVNFCAGGFFCFTLASASQAYQMPIRPKACHPLGLITS